MILRSIVKADIGIHAVKICERMRGLNNRTTGDQLVHYNIISTGGLYEKCVKILLKKTVSIYNDVVYYGPPLFHRKLPLRLN